MEKEIVLVASSDLYQTKVLQSSLEGAGYVVITCDSGESALQIVHQARPILLVLEWKMPDLSGLAIIRILRSEAQFARLPIMLIGAGMSEEDRLLGFETGADVCLSEAFDPKVFVARARALLRRIYENNSSNPVR